MDKNKLIILLVAIFILTIIFSNSIINLYIDYLWFGETGYQPVFLTVLRTQVILFIVTALVFFILLVINFFITLKLTPKYKVEGPAEEEVIVLRQFDIFKYLKFVGIIVFIFLSLGIGAEAASNWEVILRYLNQVGFGVKDPIFSQDVSFYIFSIPFYKLFLGWGYRLIILMAISSAVVYFFHGSLVITQRVRWIADIVRSHLSIFGILFFLLLAGSYYFQIFGLLYSERGTTFGVSYSDYHAVLPVLKVLIVLSVITAASFLAVIFLKSYRLLILSLAALLLVSFLGGQIYPSLIQQFRVSPDELNKEKKFILNNIKFTRQAYNLDKFKETNFPAVQTLNQKDIDENKETIENIRLWDWRPLKKTFSQIQEIRTYYTFRDVDVDRYELDNKIVQVTLSARELDTDQLPIKARTWVNEHLVYTHGYGLVMNPVNQVTEEGLPKLFIKDIPPKSEVDIKIKRPEIYYGEVHDNDDYAVINTATKELDYPIGDANEYTEYQGDSGIKIGTIGRKALFAYRFNNLRLLLSDAIGSGSKILIRRNILDRINRLAPFLRYDQDPYIFSADGKLYWMIDSYSVSSQYPYSTRYNDINYIRNSVKVVVDAYNGSVKFYVIDKEDPVLKTYQNIFPELFQDFSEMPNSQKAHIRYPIDLFKIQIDIFNSYHMTDPQVFYNREDLWEIPKETFQREEIDVEPYYVVMKPIGQEISQFLLMQPLNPSKKNNMISWIYAVSDLDNYGQLNVFKFPKEKLIYGPLQIESRIDQDPIISQQLTLWGQEGSQVIRGNLLVIPIEDGLLYVEPIYLQASKSEIPELKRVVIAYGSKITMAENLDEALANIFIEEEEEKKAEPEEEAKLKEEITIKKSVQELITEANQSFERALNFQREGKWAEYGEELENLKNILADLSKSSQEQNK